LKGFVRLSVSEKQVKGRSKEKDMKIGDILDMREYLADRCYCPNEIYGADGFFYELFDADAECEVLCEGKRNDVHGTFIIAKPIGEDKEQIVYIEHDGKTVSDCTRFDATENNREQVIQFMKGETDGLNIDEYEDGATGKALNEILSISNAVMVE